MTFNEAKEAWRDGRCLTRTQMDTSHFDKDAQPKYVFLASVMDQSGNVSQQLYILLTNGSVTPAMLTWDDIEAIDWEIVEEDEEMDSLISPSAVSC